MKRTAERIFGTIGIIMDALTAFLGIVLLVIILIGIDWIDLDSLTESSVLHTVFFVFAQLLWIPIISCVASLILGSLGIFYSVKKPNLAGTLFVVAAIISCWLLFTIGAFQSLLYLIAGLMCFFRKPVRE